MPSKVPLPRVNVTVTREQHALLIELAHLQGGSAAGFLRQQLDAATPLLRSAVPILRRAAQETEGTREEIRQLLQAPLKAMEQAGLRDQLDFIEEMGSEPDEKRNAASGSERGRDEEGEASVTVDADNG